MPSERHEVRPVIGSEGTSTRLIHWECAARMTVGSVGHQRGECACYGGAAEDPPGMTKREGARVAFMLAVIQANERPRN